MTYVFSLKLKYSSCKAKEKTKQLLCLALLNVALAI